MIERIYDLSLVICTRNRATRLAQTLKRVLAIRSQLTWELIVADNGSTDHTSAVVDECAAACHRPVRRIYEPGRGCLTLETPVGNQPSLT
jgi:glycosyltransferase involved in cell wall biosynthesis